MAMRDDFDALWRDMARFVPTDMRDAGEEFQRNFSDFVTASLRRMNLVTREEYDIQVGLLQRLEKQVSKLESQMAQLDGGEPPADSADSAGDGSPD